MRVTIDYCSRENNWTADSLGVFLDDGTEIGRYPVVDNPETEREQLEMMFNKVISETLEGAMKSVLQDWVMELPLRVQGTILTGIRGCDVAPKPLPTSGPTSHETAGRQLVAFLRYCVLNAADIREIDMQGAFFQSRPPHVWKPSQFGHYPQHWYSHLMHCFEVVGYLSPNHHNSAEAENIYKRFVKNLHLVPETREAMLKRLTEDRIANDTVVS